MGFFNSLFIDQDKIYGVFAAIKAAEQSVFTISAAAKDVVFLLGGQAFQTVQRRRLSRYANVLWACSEESARWACPAMDMPFTISVMARASMVWCSGSLPSADL